MFATRIDKELLKELKILSVLTERPVNSLMEEAITDLIQKIKVDKPSKKI